jgi:mono/diheme cytochrome c family protein
MRRSLLALALLVAGCPKPEGPTQPNAAPVEVPPDSWLAQAPREAAPASGAALLERGRALYLKRCAECHGASGAGDGPKARTTPLLPRDFRQGIFKLRSTPSGTMPTDADLFRTITRGVPGGGMPGTSDLPEPERWAVLRYVQELTIADEEDEQREPIPIPAPPKADADAAKRGRAVYLLLRCWVCHGPSGDGTGARSTEMIDDWGNPIRPPDLTKPWPYKGGYTPQDLYRTLVTGFDGSPMPAYGGSSSWLPVKGDFRGNWQERFSRDLPKNAVADLAWFAAQLPESLPRDPAAKDKIAENYFYDLTAYLRANFPSTSK